MNPSQPNLFALRRSALMTYGAIVALLLLAVILYSVYLSYQRDEPVHSTEARNTSFIQMQDSLARTHHMQLLRMQQTSQHGFASINRDAKNSY